MIIKCINEDCCEFTKNLGGLCSACTGLAQKRAEMARKAAQNHRSGVLNDNKWDSIDEK